jgi:hypothetical protein
MMLSCNDEGDGLPIENNSGIIVSEFEVQNECIRITRFEDTYVVRSQVEYGQIEFNASRDSTIDCPEYMLNPIDFSTYSLLGFKVCGQCNLQSTQRKVLRDEIRKMYIYSIQAEYSGQCKMLICNMNWVLVPRLPDGWTVEFEEIE